MESTAPQTNQVHPYSHHVFLFPFKWDVLEEGKTFAKQTFDARSSLRQFADLLTSTSFSFVGDVQKSTDDQIKLQWKVCQYNFGSIEKTPYNYSEYTYFYDFVQQALYDVKDRDNEPVRYFELGTELQLTNDARGQIPPFKDTYLSMLRQYSEWNKGIETIHEKSFQLKLMSINLHAFNTGVGVLSFFAENYDHPDPAEILIINQLARRIYPEFLETKPGKENDILRETQLATMLAKEVTFRFGERSATFRYDEYADPTKLWQQTRRLPHRIFKFFPSLTFRDDATLVTQGIVEREIVLLRNVMDDRMFTICWYGNNDLSQLLRQYDKSKDEYVYETNPFWFAFASADNNPDWPTVQHHKLLRQYIEQFTYGRWANYGTLYGVTRETFVILSEDIKTVQGPPIYQHVQQMYYQMVILCLVQRASVLRFTGEITPLARMMVTGNQSSEDSESNQISGLAGQVSVLYQHYIDFLNRLYLREITAQLQGDELYTQLQNQMELKADVDNLGKQLNELNAYVERRQRKEEEKQRKEDEKRSESLNEETRQLNTTIGWLAPLSVLGGILSFIGIDKLVVLPGKIYWNFVWGIGLYILLSVIALKVSPLIIKIVGRFVNPKI